MSREELVTLLNERITTLKSMSEAWEHDHRGRNPFSVAINELLAIRDKVTDGDA